MREFMFQPLPKSFRHIEILSTLVSASVWMEAAVNAQGMYGSYPGGPAAQGMSTAIPLPVTNPGYGGPAQPGRMVHPSASPYLFK